MLGYKIAQLQFQHKEPKRVLVTLEIQYLLKLTSIAKTLLIL